MENKVIAKEYVDKNYETWKEIKNYEGFYEVSSLGRVRSLTRYVKQKNNSKKKIAGKILKPIPNKNGYLMVTLSKDCKGKRYFVHRLVADAFILNKNNKKEVNHIDENPKNNKVNNLEWVTHLENSNYGTRGKRISKNLKEWCKKNRVKKVKQVSLNGIFIKEWESAKDVQKELGINSKGISLCATKRRKTAGGYKWIYVMED
ncbi:MAG TPA: hypothetical protein DEP51_04060 [Clostridiales bacterium]|nr:hypothetical protein [Clostridiales bacterium]